MRAIRLLWVALALQACSSLACAAPMDRNAAVSAGASTQDSSYVWYDGDQPRRAWLDPDLLATFDAPDPSTEQAIRSISPQAEALPPGQAGIRLWRIPAQGAATARNLHALEPDIETSPVLRDGPGKNAAMRALPGGLILHLNPNWTEAAAYDWLLTQHLQPVKKLAFGRNVFLIETEAGLEALHLANRLRQRDGVIAAAPNWWQELEPR